MKKARETLTEKQLQAIELAVEGKSWGDIAEAVKVDRRTVWMWRQNNLFKQKLNDIQEATLNEISLSFSTYVSIGFAKLAEIAQNLDGSYDQKLQLEAATKLIELPLSSIDKIRALEHYRREIALIDVIDVNGSD